MLYVRYLSNVEKMKEVETESVSALGVSKQWDDSPKHLLNNTYSTVGRREGKGTYMLMNLGIQGATLC
jgi:hypothetical protein